MCVETEIVWWRLEIVTKGGDMEPIRERGWYGSEGGNLCMEHSFYG